MVEPAVSLAVFGSAALVRAARGFLGLVGTVFKLAQSGQCILVVEPKPFSTQIDHY